MEWIITSWPNPENQYRAWSLNKTAVFLQIKHYLQIWLKLHTPGRLDFKIIPLKVCFSTDLSEKITFENKRWNKHPLKHTLIWFYLDFFFKLAWQNISILSSIIIGQIFSCIRSFIPFSYLLNSFLILWWWAETFWGWKISVSSP